MMNSKISTVKILAPFLIALLILANAYAFTTNGTGKIFDFAVTSGKNADISSSNFRAYSVIGDIISTINSSTFRTEVGFLRTLPYLNGESCQVNLECVGGFCCSNVCQSSACPVAGPAPSGGEAAAAGGGGGGGAALIAEIESFAIDKDLIKVLIKQGGTYKTKFTIKNDGTKELLFNIDYSELGDFLLLSDTQFTLAPGKEKEIDVTIFASEEQKPDVYSGNIRITGGSIEKALPVIIEVQAKKALFDITVKVLPKYKNVLKTEKIVANITLINVGDLKPVDAQLYYSIRDIEGNDLTYGIETLAVYNEVFRIKELELPLNITVGTYLFYARVSYGIETAAAVDVFYVVSEKPAACDDGIKNQNEEGIDCGGACGPCKFNILKLIILFFVKRYLLIIFALVITISGVFIALALKRKRDKERRRKEFNKKIDALIGFINSSLKKGYKTEQIRDALLANKWPKKIVDYALDKALLEKLKENEQSSKKLKENEQSKI